MSHATQATHGKGREIPLAIMTSDDTHDLTGVFQHVFVCCSVLQRDLTSDDTHTLAGVLQRVASCYSMLQHGTVCSTVLKCDAGVVTCCSVSQ